MSFVYPRYRHSAASGNTWLESPSAFIWRWSLQNWGEEKARTAMGKAAEHAAHAGLMHRLTPLQIGRAARDRFDELMEGEWAPERSYAVRCAIRIWQALKPLGKPIAYQPWRPVQLTDLNREVSIKIDFLYEHFLVDAKCGLAMPSTPKPMHERQVALYSGAYEKPAFLLYVTPAKRPQIRAPKSGKDKGVITLRKLQSRSPAIRWFAVGRTDVYRGATELLRAFQQIEHWEQRFNRPEDAIRLLPLNLDSFYWSDDTDAANAIQIWEQAV